MVSQPQTTHIQDAKSRHLTFYPHPAEGENAFSVINYTSQFNRG